MFETAWEQKLWVQPRQQLKCHHDNSVMPRMNSPLLIPHICACIKNLRRKKNNLLIVNANQRHEKNTRNQPAVEFAHLLVSLLSHLWPKFKKNINQMSNPDPVVRSTPHLPFQRAGGSPRGKRARKPPTRSVYWSLRLNESKISRCKLYEW